MKTLKQGIQQAVSLLLVLMLSAMVALTFTDVVGRRLFNTPVFGANDLTEHLMAVIIFAGLPLLTLQRGHLSIDLLDAWLLKPAWRPWHKLVDLLIAAVLGLIAWEYFLAIDEARQINEISPALMIPRSGMYTFIAGTTALAAVAALFAPAPHAEHLTEEFPS
ncbi:MAG: TRAP transporter small permease [Hydrogenophaga sp.]|uniref:TRAP transporter small permease n=1 Tax=Hydrogenophaga sp. TaxID=1904254 RepID=UPI00272379AF|nr:TRAP transporter small permease [Hydrogenophaga sp.]MDO9484364.1 TRAP transporter small permease [Hydrogenophaga sp.]MDP2219539.1 TRAP transporter small permease [Hydrogenophaga sp.]MDP3343877.1 TRAP transporter small permease [Hydrogenophaga sp.]MDP3375913.1 TRAP transporter small permease [Hydrogenophaga sp.]MDP3806516.1 TRAP transporter small permease [Hydrogenophaga sp.]